MPQQPSLDTAMAEVLSHLGPFVPLPTVGLPDNHLGLVTATARNLAIGYRRGSAYRAGQPVSALTGIFLDATARIEIWGAAPGDVEADMDALQANLLNAAPSLRALGFLSFAAQEITPSQHETSIPAWRKTGSFRFRYEFRASDADDADSFVVRVPVRSQTDDDGAATQETHTVVNGMRRWDDEGAPLLAIRGGGRSGVRLTGLSSFDFRPGGFVGDGVTVERTVSGIVAAPTIYPNLTDFLAATSDPVSPDRNARVSFATLPDFLAELTPDGAPIPLGDWNTDSVRDLFQPRALDFATPIRLATPRDLFTIGYAQPAFAVPAILYLRVLTIPMNSG